jgi:signal transduction histidine kinase
VPSTLLRRWLSAVRPRSLRSRLTLGVVAVLAVVLLLGGTYVANQAARTDSQTTDDRLQRTAELLDEYASRVFDSGKPPADRRLEAVLRRNRSSLILSLGLSRTVIGEPVPDFGRVSLGFTTRERGGRTYRIYTKYLFGDDLGIFRIQATTDLARSEARQRNLRRRFAAVGLAMLALAGIGTAFASGLILRPLGRLRTHALGIEDEGDLSSRVPVAGPREIRSLAGSFNAMLQRLGRSADERRRALDATRRFAADVGHEIRTPLTSVQAALSTIHRHPDVPADMRAAMIDDALAENRRLVLLLDGLQALARGDANTVEQTDVDLASVVAEAVEATGQQHPGTTFEADLPDDPVVVTGWEPGLRSLVDNLLRNAARHGRPDGRVEVVLRPGSVVAGPVLVVEDDGAGIPVDERARVFEPFARATGVQTPGSGLGLAIVAQQAAHHHVAVSIEDGEPDGPGGARFVVRFPRAQAQLDG